ncbi:MAG TPA: hypothetical protein VMP89_16725 [Solirubrobacteraceae bacterium]|nr:hypothetical protein [Solirubrobacteraceae bacterium]
MSDRPGARGRFYAVAASRFVGALALLATGGIHLEQYIVADYRVIPTIGPLFLLNFIGGTVLGLYFLVPAGAHPPRWRRLTDLVAAVSGWAIGVGGLVALFISEAMPLFGFMEHGYRLEIVIAIVAEAVTVVALSAFLALSYGGRDRAGRARRRPDGTVTVSPAAESQ